MENKLDHIFELQRGLIDKYIVIENLPPYPVNLQEKPGRVLITDFIGRIIDEMSEAYDALECIYTALNDNDSHQAKKCLEEFNEEIADVLHFTFELCIYAGFNTYTLLGLVVDSLARRSDEAFDSWQDGEETLFYLTYLGRYANVRTNIFKLLDSRADFRVPIEPIKEVHLYGAQSLSLDKINLIASFFWHGINSLSKAKRSLKHKPWAQSETKANTIAFNENLADFILILMQCLDILGKDSRSIYQSYILKNAINHDRIKNKY